MVWDLGGGGLVGQVMGNVRDRARETVVREEATGVVRDKAMERLREYAGRVRMKVERAEKGVGWSMEASERGGEKARGGEKKAVVGMRIGAERAETMTVVETMGQEVAAVGMG